MPSDIEKDLQKAIQGLLYPSETDASFEIVHWQDGENLDPKKVLQLSGHKPKDLVEIQSVEDFFKPLTDVQTWFGTEEKATAKKFGQLEAIIKQLKNPQVFKIGKIQIDIYVVGKSPTGDWVGVKTSAVET